MELVYAKVEGSGKPMIIIHGFLGMSDNWKTLGTKFAELGYEVHLLDMRNHGRSFHSMEFNYNVMVQDVVAYCEANHLKDIVVIGHSMGGKIAMKLAAEHSSLVSKLIIADMSPRAYARFKCGRFFYKSFSRRSSKNNRAICFRTRSCSIFNEKCLPSYTNAIRFSF